MANKKASADTVRTGIEEITTQGDLLYRGATDLKHLSKGSSGQQLSMGNSNEPEWITVADELPAAGTSGNLLTSTGSAWASSTPAATGSNSFKVSGQSLGNQSISTSAWTKMIFEETGGDVGLQWDKGGEFDPSTSRYTPTTAGTYIIHVFAYIHNIGSGYTAQALIYKNGSAYYGAAGKQVHGAADHAYAFITDLVDMNGTTDYVEGYAMQDRGSTTNLDGRRHMWGYRIGA